MAAYGIETSSFTLHSFLNIVHLNVLRTSGGTSAFEVQTMVHISALGVTDAECNAPLLDNPLFSGIICKISSFGTAVLLMLNIQALELLCC
jgi:hypothetical protein